MTYAEFENISLSEGTLSWTTWASLHDKEADDAFELCVYYTVLAWQSDQIDARVDHENTLYRREYVGRGHKDTQYDPVVETHVEYENGPVVTRHSTLYETPFRDGDQVAVLPRSVALGYYNAKGLTDRHVLQLAYMLGQDASAPNRDGRIRWAEVGVVKDNNILGDGSIKASYVRASLLGGSGVHVAEDYFAIRAKQKCNEKGCTFGSTSHSVKTEKFEVKNLGYDYVIPMLTGFDLSFPGDDEHVARVGAWLDRIDFDPDTGTLGYEVSTVLLDKDAKPGFESRHRVTFLGLNRRGPAVRPSVEPKPVIASTYEPFTDRPGRDYRSFDLSTASAVRCRSACLDDDRCAAWTYVKPGVQGNLARCWLKSSVPGPRLTDIGTSGVKYSIEPGIDRPGGDYRSFDLKTGQGPTACRSSCLEESRCRAWTFVEPGLQGPRPRCWLKARVPGARGHNATTSGVVGRLD